MPERPGSTWFGALRRTAGVRGRIRGQIEELVEQELEAALGRGRYERAGGTNGHRHGHRMRQLTGSFGPVEIAVPRARLREEDGSTREWRSAVLPRYARRTRQLEALIAGAYLAGTNTRHSAIRFVTPNARHTGQERELLGRRTQLYTEARAANPTQWSGQIRNWSPIGDVCLNPERDTDDRTIRDAA